MDVQITSASVMGWASATIGELPLDLVLPDCSHVMLAPSTIALPEYLGDCAGPEALSEQIPLVQIPAAQRLSLNGGDATRAPLLTLQTTE